MTKRALIFANGDVDDGPLVRRALGQAADALIIAADGGARAAREFGLALDVIIGDMDSISAADLEAGRAAGVPIHQLPHEKDETDLELALDWAVQSGADWIRLVAALGGRLDQTLANVYLLALPSLMGRDVRLVAGRQEARLLYPGETLIEGARGDTISLIPVDGTARGVRTEQLHYPLHDEDLEFGPARGISNLMLAEEARIGLREGRLLLVHTVGRA